MENHGIFPKRPKFKSSLCQRLLIALYHLCYYRYPNFSPLLPSTQPAPTPITNSLTVFYAHGSFLYVLWLILSPFNLSPLPLSPLKFSDLRKFIYSTSIFFKMQFLQYLPNMFFCENILKELGQ